MTLNEAHLLKSGVAFIASSVVVALFSAAMLFQMPDSIAYADDEKPDYQKTALELQREIETRQADLEAAVSEVDEANAAIEETAARIEELELEIPRQKERSAHALREEYKFQQQSAGIIDMLLSAGSFEEFVDGVEYMNRIATENADEVARLQKLEDEILATQDELRASQQTAEEKASDARSALAAAQEAQAEVQRRIEEEARLQAEIAARAAATAAQPRENDSGEAVNAGNGASTKPSDEAATSSSEANQEAPQEESGEPEPAQEEPAQEAPAAVEVSSDEAAFVGEWAPRIDAYLAGSPLAGQGTTFARAAYEYGVDPRFSPAISFTESSKGAVCFLPHNAWGWGSASWGSWEEAIYDHVAGLANGYGGQISEAAAQKYCPPTWQSWYNRTLEQMNLI